jgi:hypothetical protein
MADATITINANLGKSASAPVKIVEAAVDFTNITDYAAGGHLIAALTAAVDGMTFRSVAMPHYDGSTTRYFQVNASTGKVQAYTYAGAVTEIVSTAGNVTDTTSYPVADQDGNTEKVTIDGGSEQTVTFSGATTTATHVQTQMAAGLTDCTVTEVGGQVVITSNTTGKDSSVAIGTGTCALTWDTPVAGGPDLTSHDAIPVLLVGE